MSAIAEADLEQERLVKARSVQTSHLDQLHEIVLSIHKQLASLSSLSLPSDSAAVDQERESNIAYFNSKARGYMANEASLKEAIAASNKRFS